MLTQDGPTGPAIFSSYETRDQFAAAVQAYWVEVMSGDRGVSQSIWMFEGDRVRMVGDPLRSMLFPDGVLVPVVANQPTAADETKLVPPSIRRKSVPKSSSS